MSARITQYSGVKCFACLYPGGLTNLDEIDGRSIPNRYLPGLANLLISCPVAATIINPAPPPMTNAHAPMLKFSLNVASVFTFMKPVPRGCHLKKEHATFFRGKKGVAIGGSTEF